MPNNEEANLDAQNQEGTQNPESGGDNAELEAIKREKERLEKELKEREEQIKRKDEALRKKEGNLSEELEKRLEERLNEKLRSKEIDMRVNALTSDEETRKQVRHHLENTIKSTGDAQKDVEIAWAIASQANLAKLAAEDASAEAFASVVRQSQVASGIPTRDMPASVHPARKAAERILSAINPEAIKNLKI